MPRVAVNGAGDIAAAWTTGFSNAAIGGFAAARTAPPPPNLRAAGVARTADGDALRLRFTHHRAGPVMISVGSIGARRPAAAVIVPGQRGVQHLAWPRQLAPAVRRPGIYRVTFETAARVGRPAGERSAIVRIG